LARAAGDRTLAWFRRPDLQVDTKADLTPVTEADRDAERYLRAELGRRHPADAILGEEEGEQDGTSGRRWVIDPIDGTKAFTHGVPLYSTLLAALDEHGPLLGVICLPALPETVWAGRGLGCFLDGEPCHVSEHATVEGAYVTASALRNWPAGALDATHGAGAFVRTWGDAYGYALVATGRVEAMVDHQAAIWDIAPMPVIIGEAGGRMSDLAGADSITSDSGLATNGLLHDDLLALLAPGDVG
ncbi:MAG: inositol monophosphatase family protein, partial [Acidimicrobiales bacterium]